jgi:hypothetical protein
MPSMTLAVACSRPANRPIPSRARDATTPHDRHLADGLAGGVGSSASTTSASKPINLRPVLIQSEIGGSWQDLGIKAVAYDGDKVVGSPRQQARGGATTWCSIYRAEGLDAKKLFLYRLSSSDLWEDR